ncbi:tRNA (adenosine(37)-N6)-threonylcarbamoyltransferase complex ATPase subunit type 1 TsaE [Nocardioides sp. BGMRC 2183]|nr:tRNA (adenosine(37)-N6)-threonylcarbamoyltransferase complex ATPase subunit type 1 TsaE [Nocardioides sp. BGMRC 2183]
MTVIREVGPGSSAEVLAVVRAAFGDREPLDPPTDALAETEQSLAERLEPLGGLVADVDGVPAAAVVLDPVDDAVYLRRFGLTPAARGRGVARRLVGAAAEVVVRRRPEADRLVVLAREELPATVAFWRDNGFVEVGRHAPYLELARPLPRRYDVPTAEDMRELAQRLAGALAPGDVLVLTGELGAGKTTFTQGLGAGLGVRGGVTSPTFVIARVHPSLDAGPALVHVDAYRLDGAPELDDLDLDADLERAVTVVEWGEGLAEALTDSPLQVRIDRAVAAPDADPDDDPRSVTVIRRGPRWAGVRLP